MADKPKLKVLITSGSADKFGDNKVFEKYNFILIPKPYDRFELATTQREVLEG